MPAVQKNTVKKVIICTCYLFLFLIISFYGYAQNVGIGTSTPQFPLSFPSQMGDKISLWGNAGPHYGIGVQNRLLQIHSDASNSDIAFGYGTSELFTEKFRMSGTGTLRIEGPGFPNSVPSLSIGGYGAVSIDAVGVVGGRFVIGENGKTGIGINNPEQQLSVRSGMNIDHLNANNGTLDANVLRFGNFSGEAIGSGKVTGSNNQNGLDFYTGNLKRVVITNTGNMGIGTDTPGFPLNFPNLHGDKISLWGNAGAHYGFGIQGNLLQIHTDDVISDIAFGYGRSSAFTEKLRIKGNGALVINGNSGNTGQVLQSNANSSPSWKTIGSIIATYYRYPANFWGQEGVLTAGATLVFNSLTITLTVTTKSRLIISAGFLGGNGGCVGCGDRQAAIDIRINGSEVVAGPFVGITSLVTPNGGSNYTTISNFFYDVNPGTYTIEFIGEGLTGGDMYLGSKYATILALPID